MELIFLGTSSGTPTRERNVSGLAVRSEGSWDLFDCGEATQHRVLDTSLKLPRLRRVFISHLHGDHCFGLFGLLSSRSLSGADTPVHLYGPVGLEEMVLTVLRLSSSYLGYEVTFTEVDETGGRVVADDGWTIDAIPLSHRVTSFAWWMREAEQPGSFDAARAVALGIPPGPEYGRLKTGETITRDDGSVVVGSDLVGPSRPGRTLVIAGDNNDPSALLAQTGAVNVLVHEATFTEDVVAELGGDQGHSTAARVAAAAENAGVGALVLTHFSSRYVSATQPAEGRDRRTIADIRDEAAGIFRSGLHLAEDLAHFELARDGTLRRS